MFVGPSIQNHSTHTTSSDNAAEIPANESLFETYAPTQVLLKNLKKLIATQDQEQQKIYAQNIQKLPMSAWRGYELKLLLLDQKPELDSLIQKYPNITPILIRVNHDNDFTLMMYGIDENGKAILQEMRSGYFRHNLCKKFEFTKDLTSLQNDKNDIFFAEVENYKFHFIDPAIATELKNIDLNTFEQLFSALLKNNIKLEPNISHQLFRQFMNKDPESKYPLSTIYFAQHNQDTKGKWQLTSLLADHNKAILEPEYIQYLIDFLIDPDADQQLKAQVLAKTDENGFNAIGKIINVTDADNPLKEIVEIIILQNHDWKKNLSFLHAMRKNKINLELTELVKESIDVFEEKLIAGVVKRTDLKQIFGVDPLFSNGSIVDSEVAYQMVSSIVHFLSIEKLNEAQRKIIFEQCYEILNKMPIEIKPENMTQGSNYPIVQSKYLLYLVNHWKEHEAFLKTLDPQTFNRLQLYATFSIQLNKMDPDFFTAETREKLGNQLSIYLIDNIQNAIINRMKEHKTHCHPKFFPFVLPELYNNSLDDLLTMLFVDKHKNATDEKYIPTAGCPASRVIYNNTGYLNISDQTGKPLYLDETQSTPIGYNIHLPPTGTKIKNVLLTAYGGFQASEREEKANRPGGLDAVLNHLLKDGTVIITLNVPDLLKLTTSQREMDSDLHDEIHACIHHIYETLINSPEKIDDNLSKLNLQDLDIFFYGASFGGRAAMTHAERYPGTFTGYISHDGALSDEMAQKSDFLKRGRMQPWLDPAQIEQMENIKDRLLILHNSDDNNVSVKDSLHFYHLLAKLGKSDLANICITDIGNPIPANEKKHNKGHFPPETKENFLKYVSTIKNFMQGPSMVPSMSPWHAYIQDKLANKYYKSADVKEQFIAAMLEKNRLQDQNQIEDEYAHSIFKILYHIDNLLSDRNTLQSELERLEKNNLLTDEVIKNAIKSQFKLFQQYLNEMYGIVVTNDDLAINDDMINKFRTAVLLLKANKTNKPKTLLLTLYQANPELLASLPSQSDLHDCKTEYENVLAQNKKMITQIWQQTVQCVSNLRQQNFVKISTLLETIKNNKEMDFNATPDYIKLMHLAAVYSNDTKTTMKIINKLDELIDHIKRVEPNSHTINRNIIKAKIVKMILRNDPQQNITDMEEIIDIQTKSHHGDQFTALQREESREYIEYLVDEFTQKGKNPNFRYA